MQREPAHQLVELLHHFLALFYPAEITLFGKHHLTSPDGRGGIKSVSSDECMPERPAP